MAIVDKLATVAAGDYLTRVTGDIVNHASNVRHVSLEYSWADLTSAAGMVGATAKLGNQGVSLLKTVTGAGGATGAESAGDAAKTAATAETGTE